MIASMTFLGNTGVLIVCKKSIMTNAMARTSSSSPKTTPVSIFSLSPLYLPPVARNMLGTVFPCTRM